MRMRLALLCASLAFASCAQADTVFKYRDAAGRTVYANRPLPGLELLEAFEYRFPEPAREEVQAASRALGAAARARLSAAWQRYQSLR